MQDVAQHEPTPLHTPRSPKGTPRGQFPPHLFDGDIDHTHPHLLPKVMVPFETRPDQPPRKVEIQRCAHAGGARELASRWGSGALSGWAR